MDSHNRFHLWLHWVGANALAELVGLGGTLAIDIWLISRLQGRDDLFIVLGILLFSATGAIEGAIVGWLQWLVLRRPFPTISRKNWIQATILGAVIAWFFGSLPSNLMDMAADGSAAGEPSAAVVLLLAAGMGLVLGVVLAYPQWRVLRKVVPGAWIWIPANSVAWAVGMAVIFSVVDIAYSQPTLASSLLVLAAGLLLAGALVGAIHGLALIRLAPRSS